MNAKLTTITIAMIAMVAMTGFAAAMNTDVYYNGDGQYDCNYNAYGTGSIGIHTYTSDGSDHLMSGWSNTGAEGWQSMDTYSGTAYSTDYSGTVIDRSATVGGADNSEDEAGFIMTYTTDGNNNSVFTEAVYHDNIGQGSHITTDQTIVVGSLVNIGGSTYNVTGVAAATNIHGFAYGSNTTVSGLVQTQSGDEYTYVILAMDNGKMRLEVVSATGSVDPAVTVPNYPWFGQLAGVTLDGACGQYVDVDADGVGKFSIYAGTDMHGINVYLTEDGVHDDLLDFVSDGTDVNVTMVTTFTGEFTADGYVYAIDLT